VARKIVADQEDAEWNLPITHHQQLIDLITTRKRPNREQQRIVQALTPDCGFPTCRADANQCDIDHVIPWIETRHTTIPELQPLCRYHNRLKEHGWQVKRLPNGTHQWTSPLGHTYTVGPDPP
jgi:hypothetical protein